MTRRTVDDLLADARARIRRYEPAEALAAQLAGALLVDTRSVDDRQLEGIVPGSLHVPRSVLEWRLDPASRWHNPYAADLDRELVLLCAHGFSSTLAAATLADLGFRSVGDVVGGFEAWAAAGLPVVPAPAFVPSVPGSGLPDG